MKIGVTPQIFNLNLSKKNSTFAISRSHFLVTYSRTRATLYPAMSVCWSDEMLSFFGVHGRFLHYYPCQKAWLAFTSLPCPPARDLGSCASGLVLIQWSFFIKFNLTSKLWQFCFPFVDITVSTVFALLPSSLIRHQDVRTLNKWSSRNKQYEYFRHNKGFFFLWQLYFITWCLFSLTHLNKRHVRADDKVETRRLIQLVCRIYNKTKNKSHVFISMYTKPQWM